MRIYLNKEITIPPLTSVKHNLGLKFEIPSGYEIRFGNLFNRIGKNWKREDWVPVPSAIIENANNLSNSNDPEFFVIIKNITGDKITLGTIEQDTHFTIYFAKIGDKSKKGVPVRLDLDTSSYDQGKTRLKLMEMANSYDISATATTYMVQAIQPHLKSFTLSANQYREGLDKKLYIPIYLNKFRVVACLDSGSDLTIMQLNLYNRIFGRKKLEPCNIPHIKSFSNNNIKVIGQITCDAKFDRNWSSTATLTIIVIGNINEQIPTFLFGNDSFKACLATLGYTGLRNDPEPEFILNIPEPRKIPVYQASPQDTVSCTALYDINPYETKNIEFALHSAAPVLRNFEVIISSYTYDLVQVLPSKSTLEFNIETDCYYATACIVNLSHLPQAGEITARVEIISRLNEYTSYQISSNKRDSLIKIIYRII